MPVHPSRSGRAAALVALSLTLPLAGEARADDRPSLSIYGFARLDFIVNDSAMSDVEAPAFVLPEPESEEDEGNAALTMHPRLTRLGLDADEWDLSYDGDVQGKGKIEIDFAGGGGDPAVRLRHAYAAIDWDHKVEILAGQTWDLASPLFPSAQNDTQLLFAGNTGDRRAQFRLSVFPTSKLRVATSVGAPGAVDHQDADDDGQLDGIASAAPMFQWLVEYRRRMSGDTLRAGIWGHLAQDELADGTERASHSFGAHLFVPVMRQLIVLGEIYAGKNTDDLGGGIAQGLNPTTTRGIESAGGWFEVAMVPSKAIMVALGGSVDTAAADDLDVGGRESNFTLYAIQRIRPKESIQLGLEFLAWRTDYKDAGTGTANRFNVHLSVFF
jgi:hypothetical protein